MEEAGDCCVLLAMVTAPRAGSSGRNAAGAGTACGLLHQGAAAVEYEPNAKSPRFTDTHDLTHTTNTHNTQRTQIDDVQYTPTLEALQQVFTVYGPLAKMLLYSRAGQWQALVQFKEAAAAGTAKQYLHGYAMYPGGVNKVRVIVFSICSER